jgi:ABC-2 type transport system ATP-binding protein
VAADPAIVTEQLTRSFGDEVVVNGVDLSVPAGEVFACVGPPGSGRGPLIRMLCGLLSPTSGKAKVAGFDVASQTVEVRRRVGLVTPGLSLNPMVSGRQSLRFLGQLYGMGGSELERRVGSALELAGVDKAAADQPFSACEAPGRRRLELAVALLPSPEVLFLNEATTDLDPGDRVSLLDDVRKLQRSLGITIFLATRATAEADQVADRVAILDRGRVVAEGTLAELKMSVGTELIALRVQGSADNAARAARAVDGVDDAVVNGEEITLWSGRGRDVLSPIGAAVTAQGITVLELGLRRSTLDDVFRELTGVHIERLGGRSTIIFQPKK